MDIYAGLLFPAEDHKMAIHFLYLSTHTVYQYKIVFFHGGGGGGDMAIYEN